VYSFFFNGRPKSQARTTLDNRPRSRRQREASRNGAPSRSDPIAETDRDKGTITRRRPASRSRSRARPAFQRARAGLMTRRLVAFVGNLRNVSCRIVALPLPLAVIRYKTCCSRDRMSLGAAGAEDTGFERLGSVMHFNLRVITRTLNRCVFPLPPRLLRCMRTRARRAFRTFRHANLTIAYDPTNRCHPLAFPRVVRMGVPPARTVEVTFVS